jgi:cobalt-zinc-cadmium efflux system outer membrane protein
MNKLTRKVLTGLFVALWTLTVRAETNTTKEPLVITEQQAIALFYQNNLSLIATSLNIENAQAEQVIAAAIPNPVFSFTLSSLSPKIFQQQYSDRTTLPAISPQIQQLIETAGKRRLRIESSELATEAVNYDLKDTVRVLSNAVRRGYYDLLLAQKTAKIASDNFERYRDILKANSFRLKAGDIAETDFTRIEIESLKAQGDQNQAETALSQARADLLLLLGWPKDSLDISAAEPWANANSTITHAGQDELAQRALAQRPDLQAARIRIDQAKNNRC